MVQIVEEFREPSRGEKFGNAIRGGINLIGQYMGAQRQQEKADEQYQQENAAIRSLTGFDPTGIRDPRMRQKLVEMSQEAMYEKEKNARSFQNQLNLLKEKNKFQQEKNKEDTKFEDERYQAIAKYFGKEAAEMYKAAPEGGKTAFLESLLEGKQRGLSLQEQLGIGSGDNEVPSIDESNSLSGAIGSSSVGANPREKIPKEMPEKAPIKAVDYDKGLTPKERIKRQEERYKINLPIFQKSQERLRGWEAENDSLNIMEELSPQIEFYERLNINPISGELLIPGLASDAAQRFVKTVNDFTTKAKDSYGARVTNFDLQQFMKRLPTLANSESGREQIIQQMKLVNEINRAYEKNLQEIIDEHGGIRNIDMDKAEDLA